MGMHLVRMLGADHRAARRLIVRTQRRFAGAGHPVPLRLWDGTEVGAGTGPFRLVLHHPWSLRAIVMPGTDLAAGEAFVSGAFDVEGSMVEAIHTVAALREEALSLTDRLGLLVDVLRLPRPPVPAARGRAALSGEVHSRERDASAIRHHYDVGNDFYELFLDANLVYSCGCFATAEGKLDDPGEEGPTDPARPVTGDGEVPAPPRTALDRAQVRKLDLVCRKLHLREGDRVLDVGCGWGSWLIHAARHYGVVGVGVTLSEQQAALARRRVAAAGLAEQIEIRLEDYRDVRGRFDAVASLGMFEHVGVEHHRRYFRRVFELCRPGGRFLNQHITTGRRMEVRDMAEEEDSFLGSYVFPDGALVPAWMALRGMQEAGFELRDVEQFREDYARTLRHWVARLEGDAAEARARGGEAAYRIWRAYMAASVVGFETHDLGDIQALGVRPPSRLPAGRAWMTPRLPGHVDG